MMSSRIRIAGGAGFGLAILGLLALSSLSVVGESEQAVILRMGQADRVINRFRPDRAETPSGAGLALHVPLYESVAAVPRGLLSVASEGQSVRTADGQTLVLDTGVTVRVIDPVRLVARLGSSERIAAEFGAWLPAMLKEELGKLGAGQVLLPGAGGAAARLAGRADARAREYGVQVIDLRFTRVLLPAGAQSDTLQAMEQRRAALASEERTRGARDVQLIQAEAQAEAAALLQASAGRDPEFYDFYRALRSYELIFGHPDRKDKATIVLPPDSGYLKQFNPR